MSASAAHAILGRAPRLSSAASETLRQMLLLLLLLTSARGLESKADSWTHVEMVFSSGGNSGSSLPEVVHYNLSVDGHIMTLKLQKNDLMTAAPVFTMGSGGRFERVNVSDDAFNNTEFYQDVRGIAAVSLRRDSRSKGPHAMEGIIFHGGSTFHIRPSKRSPRTKASDPESLHELRKMSATNKSYDYAPPRRSGASFSPLAGKRQSNGSNEEQRAERYRRAVPQYQIDLLYVTDYSTFQSTLQELQRTKPSPTEAMVLQEMRYYFAHVSNAVDMRYRSINSPSWSLRTKLVAFYMSTSAADSTWTESLKTSGGPSGHLAVNSSTALDNFQKWITGATFPSAIPSFDHAVLYTGYDIFADDGSGGRNYDVIGLAYLGALCTPDSVSIVELTGALTEAGTQAHELGHSLSAEHDGEGNSCPAAGQYIMAAIIGAASAATELNYYLFSNCSIAFFTSYISTLVSTSKNCMADAGNYYDASDWAVQMQRPPGQVYSLNDLCRQSFGPTYEVCGGTNYGSKICRELYCYNASAPDVTAVCYGVSAGGRGIDGTTCGNHKWCQSGICTSNTSAPAASDLCPIGDYTRTTAVYSNAPYVCSNMPSYYCYDQRVYNDCCSTCSQIEDKSRPGCEFGDKINCTGLSLLSCPANLGSCCKYCQDNKLPIPGCEWGDSFSNCAALYPRVCSTNPQECCATCFNGSLSTSTAGVTTTIRGLTDTAGVTATTRGPTATVRNSSAKPTNMFVILLKNELARFLMCTTILMIFLC